jgi:hypothetical protein
MIPALKPLEPPVGRWETVIRWSEETHKLVGGPVELNGEARFIPMKDGRFLHYQFGPSHWIIGRDDTSPEYTVLYSDDREYSRVYRMILSRRVWKIWRDAPKFHQRFEARLGRGRRSIKAYWDRSVDGKKWVHDFDIKYLKIG